LEQHTVSGIEKEVNTFLAGLRIFTRDRVPFRVPLAGFLIVDCEVGGCGMGRSIRIEKNSDLVV
jgi:hypothetical protein